YGTTGIDGVRRPQYLPNKGQAIRDDGLVIAARRFDKLWAAIDSHVGETQHVSPHFDRCEYVDADPEHYKARLAGDFEKMERTGSRVVDIQVWRGETKSDRGVYQNAWDQAKKTELDIHVHDSESFFNDIVRVFFSLSK
ncbi:hypothetical protein, partial [Salmonella enterica]|uniref:hypothetical protein n=1 Tax=Salmonella enterica TaxID=28901 RepID=UPI001931089A